MSAADLSAAVRVRKARRRSFCALYRSPIVTGQQISSSDGLDWTHVQCFIADRKERMAAQYSYGEVGHDPPVHVVVGVWQGPHETSRATAVNVSMCGKRLARERKKQPSQHDLCRKCEDLMTQNKAPAPAEAPPVPAETGVPESLMHAYDDQIVQMGQMFVDRAHAQQRGEQASWVKEIADNFSWETFNLNPVALSARPDGRFHVIDGQHRVAGARQAGHGPDTKVRAHVWYDLSFEQEAALFVLLNGKRHTVKPLDLFRAKVTAGDEDAAAIDVLLNTYGWKVGSAGREGNFAAVTTLRRFYSRISGPEVCDKIIATITRAWGLSPDGANQTVIKAIGAFHEQYPRAEPERMAQVLKRDLKPSEIHVWAHERSWQKVAVLRLQEMYDKGLRDPRRRLGSVRG